MKKFGKQMKKAYLVGNLILSILLLSGFNHVFAYEIIEYFSKDVEDFKVYGEYVNESDRDKNFLSIVLVAHVHRGDDLSDRNNIIQSFHRIYESLIKDRWQYESRQGKRIGSVTIEFYNDRARTEIDIDGMERPYRIHNTHAFEEVVIRKLNKEIREKGHTGIRRGVYINID